MTIRRFLPTYMIIGAVFWVAGCAGNRPEITAEPENLPGVYPAVRAEAEIQAEKLIATSQMKAEALEQQNIGDADVQTSEQMWQFYLKGVANPDFVNNSRDTGVDNNHKPADSSAIVDSSDLAPDVISPNLLKLTA